MTPNRLDDPESEMHRPNRSRMTEASVNDRTLAMRD